MKLNVMVIIMDLYCIACNVIVVEILHCFVVGLLGCCKASFVYMSEYTQSLTRSMLSLMYHGGYRSMSFKGPLVHLSKA